MVERTCLVIRYDNRKAIKEVEKVVDITYISSKQKYIIAYCDRSEEKEISNTIRKIKGIKKISESKVDMSKFDYQE